MSNKPLMEKDEDSQRNISNLVELLEILDYQRVVYELFPYPICTDQSKNYQNSNFEHKTKDVLLIALRTELCNIHRKRKGHDINVARRIRKCLR